MHTWGEFTELQPVLARLGKSMLFGHGIGLGFVATVRMDGGPRVHPICPLVTDDGLYAFIVPGPKLDDLRRDQRYALHCETFPPPDHDDAFYLTGHIVEHTDPTLRSLLSHQFLEERNTTEPWAGFDDWAVVEFRVDRALLTLTKGRDGLPAGHTVWRSPT